MHNQIYFELMVISVKGSLLFNQLRTLYPDIILSIQQNNANEGVFYLFLDSFFTFDFEQLKNKYFNFQVSCREFSNAAAIK